eukprot:9407953-Pyramimonas_sp.AAC.1
MESPTWPYLPCALLGPCCAGTRGRQLEGAPNEAPCAICRGVGLITAELHYALAGEHYAEYRHE